MSMKGKARITAVQALRGIAKVRKLQGQLHVLRTTTTGRTRDWQRVVTKAVAQILPKWKIIKVDGGTLVMEINHD